MMRSYGIKIMVAMLLTIIFTGQVNAAQQKIATITITEQEISIQGNDGFSHISFTIVGPDNFMVENYLGNEKLSMIIDDFSTLKDGHYQYEITAATAERKDDGKRLYNNGRTNRKTIPFVPAKQTGSFLIKNGFVITSDKRIKNQRMMMYEGADQDEKK